MHSKNISQGQLFEREHPISVSCNNHSCSGFQQHWDKPIAKREFQRIEEHYSFLASTGCSLKFCQSGRKIHTDEPRVGKDRPIHQIEAEAVDFLGQMRHDNFFQSDTIYQTRLKEVLKEIHQNAVITLGALKAAPMKPGNGSSSDNLSSHGWIHTHEELEYGIRAAWKHSRKCIMRSQYQDLRLCDLRHVRSSAEMGKTIVERMKEAFDYGAIQPTVFVFPARQAGKSGPMIWNQQLLAFAGYTNDDGSILGDAMNTSLTTSIIELGWDPPKFRTKWDLLPLVTMAEGEAPIITSISKEDFPLVRIFHPRFELSFEKLGLRWVPAPALSQLGFDIGGVQYTASPFIGWFMDAEIGVRDLADKDRYNALPSIVSTLYSSELCRPLDQLPEHQRLALLSRAQAELNFAVYHSFAHSGVRMSDTLTASSNYCQFDDEHLERHGFRLPADPYWLAPPQGSIIPIWHRGGAPHYQPKPMICRHRENPVRAWKRWQNSHERFHSIITDKSRKQVLIEKASHIAGSKTQVLIHYCSIGTVANKLAQAVYNRLQEHYRHSQEDRMVLPPQPLNSLNISSLSRDDIVIIIASCTAQGNVPANGQHFIQRLRGAPVSATRFSIFGNGDSSYVKTFNSAARTLYDLFREAGFRPLDGSYIDGDNAKESPPWKVLDAWLKILPSQISKSNIGIDGFPSHHASNVPSIEELKGIVNSYTPFKLERCPDSRRTIKKVILSSNNLSYSPMDYLLVLVPNEIDKAVQTLRLLGKETGERIPKLDDLSYLDFLRDFVELEEPFRDTAWAEKLVDHDNYQSRTLRNLSVAEALNFLPRGWQAKVELSDVLVSMPLIRPRTFSIASSIGHAREENGKSELELLVQTQKGGKFSERYLKSAGPRERLRGKIKRTRDLRRLYNEGAWPILAFVTGSGFAPVQSLLRFRAQKVREAHGEGESRAFENQISLFVGFRSDDAQLIREGVSEAVTLNLLDMLFLTPSNERKVRTQDKVFRPGIRDRVEAKIRNGAFVFVCANPVAADDVALNLSSIIGCDVRAALGEKYIEDRFTPS